MENSPLLLAQLQAHFGVDPAGLPALEQNYAFYERANLHLAIEELAKSAETPPTLLGIVVDEDHSTVSLSKLSRPATAQNFDIGPVEYVDEPLPNKQRLRV